ncbi:hypothetical protein SDC9_04170 [bioreactor metagenome]|uniref:Uncharacterized protein n=1 Tax=bioreactor metagenome TaxID=1076179 RepID=A0A644SVF9_9ZZZZ|nr:hypothetical protein [Negativicutes bacterium]
MSMEISVSLSTICGGAMEEQFQQLYPALLAQLREGNKASLSINISFKKVQDTSTMINTSYKITPKFPASGKASICQITGDYKLKTEAPVEKPQVITLFKAVEGGNKNE